MKIGNTEIEEMYMTDRLWWKIGIEHSFPNKGHWWVGVRERIIKEAIRAGVEKFLFLVDGREEIIDVPTEKQMKKMERAGLVEEVIKNYPTSPMKLFHFAIK